ncbi:MAG: SRPBCC family protein [Bacteroidetes bacterium]|nr:SRPBCC family protein [Bacteroidota bacterium]MBK8660218.1 SRPBCC family protein [Bacteroidota bacterium]
MKKLNPAFYAFICLAALLCASGCAPKNYDIKREITVQAPVEVVFNQISSHANFLAWSPWQELDTAQQVTFEGTDGTVGAKYTWKGNDEVGEGSMTFTAIEPGKRVEQDLHFIKPFESSSQVYMLTEIVDAGTKVTWGMKGENNFIARIFMTFMGGMDGMVGKDFEKGLAKLKTICESAPAAVSYEVKEVEWTAKKCLSIRKQVTFDAMSAFFGQHYPAMYTLIEKAGSKAGIPLGIYYQYDEVNKNADLAAAVPFDTQKKFGGDYAILDLPARKGYCIDYYGAYDKMMPAYAAMDAKLKELGKEQPALVIEEYVSDPMADKDLSKCLTRIYFFVD